MLKQITIFRRTGHGRNAQVFDVLERLGQSQYGSAANAALVCIKESAVFKAGLDDLRSAPADDRPSKRRKSTS